MNNLSKSAATSRDGNTAVQSSLGVDFKESLQNIADTVLHTFDAACCILFHEHGDEPGDRMLAAAGIEYPETQKILISDAAATSELKNQRPVFIENVAEEVRLSILAKAGDKKIVSAIALPFAVPPDMNLVLWIFLSRPLADDDRNPRLNEAVCRLSAASVNNALRQALYLETFRNFSAAIHEGEAAEDLLNSIVTNIHAIMKARGCIYWIVDTERRDIYMKATSGFQMENLSVVDYDTLEEVFKLHSDREINFEDVRSDPRIPSSTKLGKQMVTSILAVPFHIVDSYRGVLAVYFSQPRTFTESEIEFVRASGRQGAIALHKAFRYDEKIFKVFRETIEGLVMVLEAKDVCTHGHSLNVATYAQLTALEMGLEEKEVETIYHAGLLHDIGKIAMHDTILANLGSLPPGEFDIVKKHPLIGARIIDHLTFLSDAAELIRCHHERYDGTGYPEGLQGRAIPLGARIIAVSDSFDAMTSQRPGTSTVGVKKAISMILEQAGTMFAPEVVSAFVRAIEKNPEKVKPFILDEDYFTRHADELSVPVKQTSPLARMLRKCLPGF